MKTPQIKTLIGRVRNNKRAACATRTYEQVRAVLVRVKQQREITSFSVLLTT